MSVGSGEAVDVMMIVVRAPPFDVVNVTIDVACVITGVGVVVGGGGVDEVSDVEEDVLVDVVVDVVLDVELSDVVDDEEVVGVADPGDADGVC